MWILYTTTKEQYKQKTHTGKTQTSQRNNEGEGQIMRHSIKYTTYFHLSMYNSPHLPDNKVKFDFTENRSAVKLLWIFMTLYPVT